MRSINNWRNYFNNNDNKGLTYMNTDKQTLCALQNRRLACHKRSRKTNLFKIIMLFCVFWGVQNQVYAAPTFSLSLAGPAVAALNKQTPFTATLKNTSTTTSTAGTISVKTTLPLGVSFGSSSSSSGAFSCSSVGQNGTCTRSLAMSPGTTDTITVNLTASTTGAKTGSFNVSGGGSVSTVTSNSITTTFVSPSDLSVSIKQPNPALKENAMSQVEVRVDNNGSSASVAPTTLTFNLPLNVSAPLKFSRVADNWVCTTSGRVVTCNYSQNLPVGNNTRLRIPVIPATGTVGTVPAPFKATVATDALETNVTNNGPVSMTPAVAVAPLVLATIPPTNPDGTDNLNFKIFASNDLIDPVTIPKYALPLPNLLAPFYKHTPVNSTGADKFTLDIKKVSAQILPPGFPSTSVYAYGDPSRPDTFSYPAHTIEARSTNTAVNASALGKATQVQYQYTQNALTDTIHLLAFVDTVNTFTHIVDTTIIGANAGTGSDHAPINQLLEPEIRSVAHLHGALRNNADSNGYPEAWHAPNGRNGFNVALAFNPASPNPTVPFNPGPFNYSNNQEASMLWYHDNTLGIARHNVYAGLTGLYVIRDDNEAAMIANNKLPAAQHEVPLVLQDRMFHTNGNLAYPVVNPGSFNPVPPDWVPEFYGDVMVVNGVAWPYLQVEPRLYRFRVLNASNSRFYKLSLMDNSNTTATISFKVIGTDGGFLSAPTSTTSLTMAPGERYDIIVDFSTFRGKNLTLKNAAGNLFGDALAKPEVMPTKGLVDQVMQFKVNLPKTNAPLVTLPASLRATSIPSLTATVATPRKLFLWETTNDFARIEPIMGTPSLGQQYWVDAVSEQAKAGSVETWEIYNNSFYPDPIHIEGATLQIVNRQEFTAIQNEDFSLGLPGAIGQLSRIAFPSAAVTPAASEKGWKDTVIVNPSPNHGIPPCLIDGCPVNGNVTRLRVRFDSPAGQYAWHSQRLEHQEHEMIRPLTVTP
jgi:spore coat protein A, manganese oxidase